MNFKKYLLAVLNLFLVLFIFHSCVRSTDWETPPINCTNKFDAPTMTMAQFVAMAPTSTTAPSIVIPATGNPIIFDAYVISSDENGNFYKTISFQDKAENPTVGLQMEVDRASNYADFPVGTHIRIKANGLVLGTDRGLVKIGAVDPTFAIGRIPNALFSRYIAGVCKDGMLDIETIIPIPLNSLAEAENARYLNTLVTVKNVQFSNSIIGKTYLDYVAGAGVDTEINLEDIQGNTVVLRNTAFFTAGKTQIPTKSGEISFVVSRYLTNFQMLIRGLSDVRFDKERLVLQLESFNSYAIGTENFLPNFYNNALTGNKKWAIQGFGNNRYLQLSGLNSGLIKTHFAIPVDFTKRKNLSFKTNAGYYNGEVLKVYWSKNYDPANPIIATLNNITVDFDISKGKVLPASGSNYETNFRPSGVGVIPATGNGYIIFEYNSNSTGSSGISTTMQLDDINIF